MNERHKLIWQGTTGDGEDEYFCPICLRRILVDIEEKNPITVLEEGNSSVEHYGSYSRLGDGYVF